MVHHRDLLRTESTNQGSFVAPIGDYKNDVDCGCSVLPCFAQKLQLEKFAKPGYFVAVLSLVGFFHGCIVKYFRGTSQLWSKHYDISPDNIDSLAYSNEAFSGIFAVVLAYWGNKVHRATWLGTLIIYLSVCCITLGVPEIFWPFSKNETDIDSITGAALCTAQRFAKLTSLRITDVDKVVAFGIILVYQIIYALCTISFICHGVTYVDDNISPKHSPGFIGLVLAVQRIGKQVGIYSSWAPFTLISQQIFVSPLWIVIAILTFLVGSTIAMFPRILPNTLLRKSVVSLLNVAAGNEVNQDEKKHDGFFKSVWRVTKNKILFFNVQAIVFMQAAIITFTIFEKKFNQSNYHVSNYNDESGYSDPSLIQFTTNLLKQPMIGVSFLTTGVVIAKVRPKAKYLIYWNIGVYILIGIFFASLRFLKCTNPLKNESDGRLSVPYCSWDCGCLLDGPFKPICLNGETYFSPCFAGCSSFDMTLKIYQNCTCGDNGKQMAIDGSCDADNCRVLWSIAQVNSIFSSALVASTMLTSMLICLRCVSSKDKALALGTYLGHLGTFPYMGLRPLYDWVSGRFCLIYGKTRCQLYSESFSIFLASATLALIVLAVIFSVILLLLINKLELYRNNNSRTESDLDISELRRNAVLRVNIGNQPGTSTEEGSALIQKPSDILRNKQKSESKIDTLAHRSSKEDRVNTYLSEGDLVPPLKSTLKPGRSASNRTSNSNQSALTDSSLSVIANNVGDDHDSDFSSLQRPQRVKMLEKQLQEENDLMSVNRSPRLRNHKIQAIIEHEQSSDSSEFDKTNKPNRNELIETSF